MPRYIDDFRGITGHDMPGRGMDPNYRGGYHGLRRVGGPWQAEYGNYRSLHPGEFYPGPSFVREGGRPHYGMPPREARQGRSDGGVRRLRYDRELMREYNANSPAIRWPRGRYDEEQRHRGPAPVPRWAGRGSREYTDRGMPPAGYSDGWARGPMPGSR